MGKSYAHSIRNGICPLGCSCTGLPLAPPVHGSSFPSGKALGPLHMFSKTFNDTLHLANSHHPYLSLNITFSES